jgi:hypothetical protein
MKTWKHAIIGGMAATVTNAQWSLRSKLLRSKSAWTLILIIALAFTACKDGNDNGKEPPKPVEVTFNVPDECTNLNKTKPITILFPATLTTARMDNIKGKFIDAMSYLNTDAGNAPGFKAKINAILDRGLKITVVETNSLSYGMKVVNNQIMTETAYLEDTAIGGMAIAGAIIWLMNENQLTKAPQPNAYIAHA